MLNRQVDLVFLGLEPGRRRGCLVESCGQFVISVRLETKSPQSFDDCLDQTFDLPVIGVSDMLVAALTADVRSQVVELSPDRINLKAAKAFGQDRTFEPVVEIVRQHLDQQK